MFGIFLGTAKHMETTAEGLGFGGLRLLGYSWAEILK